MRALIFLLMITGLTLMSCDQKNVSRGNQDTSNLGTNTFGGPIFTPFFPPFPGVTPTPQTTPTPQGGGGYNGPCPHGDGTEPGIADAGQTFDYYRINDPIVVAHGAATNVILWNSEQNLPASFSPNVLVTNSRMKVRVIPRIVQRGTTDSQGRECIYDPVPWSILNVGIRIRRQGETVGDYFQFRNVDIQCASRPHSFNVPATSDPLVIEVLNIESDLACLYSIASGIPGGDPAYCPTSQHWLNDCIGVELQFVTDTTKDFGIQ